jgi:transposase
MSSLTSRVEVKAVFINGHKIKSVRLPRELTDNGCRSPKLFFKTLHHLEHERAEIVLTTRQLRRLVVRWTAQINESMCDMKTGRGKTVHITEKNEAPLSDDARRLGSPSRADRDQTRETELT